jgi:hypothetical protein
VPLTISSNTPTYRTIAPPRRTCITLAHRLGPFIDDATRFLARATNMPRSRSASVDIIPPAGSRQPGLAAVMEAAYRSNSDNTKRAAEEDDVDDADGEADEIEDDVPPPTLHAKKRQPPDFVSRLLYILPLQNSDCWRVRSRTCLMRLSHASGV